MKQLVAFDLDGTLAESKQAIKDDMGEALADLLTVAHVAVISGGDWPQFDKQVASRLPERADRSKLWLMPTTGTKLLHLPRRPVEHGLCRTLHRRPEDQDPQGLR